MIMFIKRKIINLYKMSVVKQIDIKNQTYYFYNGMILIQSC